MYSFQEKIMRYAMKKRRLRETVQEEDQILDLLNKDLKSAIEILPKR